LDVWTLDGQPSPQVVFTGTSVQDTMKVGSPGASKSAITVASYTTKVQYTDIDGQVRAVGLTLDDISDFSSEGPLRDGTPKPDLAAPGAMIVSALSADSSPSRAEMVNPKYVVKAGTSMATPFMVGIVALLLERDPSLEPAVVKELLHENSLIPGQEPGTFDTKWGFGLIDAAQL
jgi:subtilisin family serine protease